MTIAAYPLQWPEGWKRSTSHSSARFGTSREYVPGRMPASRRLSVADGVERVLDALGRMGISRDDTVISTNLRLRLDGLPRSDQSEPSDMGAAVYWETRKGGRKVMAIDQYDRVADNLAAIAATLEALRAVKRHGGGAILDRAFTGFTALPAPAAAYVPSWRVALGITGSDQITEEALKGAYRVAASKAHPDKPGGSNAAMAMVNTAYETGRKALGFT